MILSRKTNRRYNLPLSYKSQIAKGRAPKRGDDLHRLSRIHHPYEDGASRPGTDGFEYQNDPGLALKLTQGLVRQGFTGPEIRAEHFNPDNVGFLWVRRQKDPDAASEGLVGRCNLDAAPMIPTADRHELILELLSDGCEHSQKAITRYVGNARLSRTEADLQDLERVGAISVRLEPHGSQVWKRIKLAVSPTQFRSLSLQLRRDLATKLHGLAQEKQRRERAQAWAIRSRTKGSISTSLVNTTQSIEGSTEGDTHDMEGQPLTVEEMLKIVEEISG